MQAERHRARRYSFVASVDLTDVQSEAQLRGQTSDLSLFGCYVKTRTPFSPGTRVSLRIAHGGANFVALAQVVYAQQNLGMGVFFTAVEPNNQAVLEKWLAELRGR